MTTRIFADSAHAAHALAREVANAITANPRLVLGLPTGRTPIPFYRELVVCCARKRIDCSRVTTFNVDEFLGIRATDPRSYRAFMQRHLFDHLNLAPQRIHFLRGVTPDPAAECRRYERAIVRAGGIDLLVLGLGANGHIGFNEPAAALVAHTHRARLTPATRRANAALFGRRASAVPREALSMGMATILRARRIVLLATGSGKAGVVKRMISGPLTPHVPASFLQLHEHAEVWVDLKAAAKAMRVRGARAR